VQVNCLRDICGFNGATIGDQDGNPARPTAQQFWRWFTSPFIHLGIIHIIIIIPIQLYIGIKIERTIGWLRLGLIYLISAVGGNIVSLRVI
jgi:membrane associated rhomboid family serine protease